MSMTHDTLWLALHAATGEIGALRKDAKAAGGTRHQYASLPQILSDVRPALWAHGLILTHHTRPMAEIGLVEVDTIIIHAQTGAQTMCSIAMPPHTPVSSAGNEVLTGPQQVAYAITSARRAGIACLLGLAESPDEVAAPQQVVAPTAPQHTPDEAEHRASVLRDYYGDDVLGGIRSLIATLPADAKLRAYLASGRDPIALPVQGWAVMVEAMREQADQAPVDFDAIDTSEDIPL